MTFSDVLGRNLQTYQAPNQKSDPFHKQKFFAKNYKSSALTLAKQKAITKNPKKLIYKKS